METATLTTQKSTPCFIHFLKFTYGLVPIVAGLDKEFTNLLADWDKYLHHSLTQLLPFSPSSHL